MNAINAIDFYKADHRSQYPKGTSKIYSNLTARTSRIASIDKILWFGLQYFIESFLQKEFDEFFQSNTAFAVRKYKRRLDNALGPDAVSVDHITALHKLGYLPIQIKALKEGTLVPLQVPMMTITNTKPEFFWLVNYIETIASATLWGPSTSATTAYTYRKRFERFASQTGANKDFVKWQGHDFSFRGMFGLEAARMSGAGHLLSFTGTDTVPAIDFLEEYYSADSDKEMVGGSVFATEHSVMCAGGMETEEDTYKRLITEVYPKGAVSIVSDTWDFWAIVTETLPRLKKDIMAREGKVVIRPDSGDPVLILTGDENAPEDSPEHKGLVELLWDIFGGTVTHMGFKTLDPHIGAIYGDSITLERQGQILTRLMQKGFASDNVVLGIGSFTYQYVTRDTFGFAMKATYSETEVNGVKTETELFKAPKTDPGKNSHKGLLHVYEDEKGNIKVKDRAIKEEEEDGLLELVYKDGKLLRYQTLADIRSIVEDNLAKDL